MCLLDNVLAPIMISKLNVLRTVKALEGATPHLTGIQVSLELDHMYNCKIENNALKYQNWCNAGTAEECNFPPTAAKV